MKLTARRIETILKAAGKAGQPVEIIVERDTLTIRPVSVRETVEDAADRWLREHGEGGAAGRA